MLLGGNPLADLSADRQNHSGMTNAATWIEIQLDRLISNLRNLKQLIGTDQQVMAVVKANAYGHGLLETAKAFAGEVQYLGVSNLYEALELKERGVETPIFLFGRLFGTELRTAVKSGLTLSASSLEEAEEISEASLQEGKKISVHVKVDTGMGRLGIPEYQAVRFIPKMAELKGILLDGIYTHLPTSERNDGFAETQAEKFKLLIEALRAKGIKFRVKHLANSAACLRMKRDEVTNLVRPGLILYGIYPDILLRQKLAAKPVLSLKSRIILVKRIEKGDPVGYGRDFTASQPTTIATLAIGYSHGYPFALSNRAEVLSRGKRYPIAGRVSMDYLTFDLGNDPAEIGAEVTLIGEDESEAITVEEAAKWAGTIPYEIVTRFASRLPRFYHA